MDTQFLPVIGPDGFDVSIDLPDGVTHQDLNRFVVEQFLAGVEDLEGALVSTYGLSPKDAFLARERTFGGIVRAATDNPANEPDPRLDPVAHSSYALTKANRWVVDAVYPEIRAAQARRREEDVWRREDQLRRQLWLGTVAFLILVPVMAVLLVVGVAGMLANWW